MYYIHNSSLKFLCKMCVHVTRLASAPIVKGGTPN